jgi:endonuclease YncB( thermonuclease family)
VFIIAGLWCPPAYPADTCGNHTVDQVISVDYVIDGDTIISSEDRHIRLIGIDTPEINHDTGRPEPGAYAAREYLQELLAGTAGVDLVLDTETHDRYGRLLAHVLLPDGTNVQAALLEQGLAVPFTYPPNLKFAECYRQAAAQAAASGRGLWRLPGLQPMAAGDLNDEHRGYRVIKGEITKIINSERLLILFMAAGFSIKIHKADLQYFNSMDVGSLAGRQIRAQGHIFRQGGELQMRIRHQNDITIMSAADNPVR